MKSPETLSLDYEVSDDGGHTTSFGDLIIGEHDVNFIDWESVYKKLNPKEIEILNLTLLGKSPKDISESIGMNVEVVRRHLRKIKLLSKENCYE
jgi:DNA-binding CsgD family transcriptional regulator